MGTQLIFTVGTNPLPVWVAWYHLKNQLGQNIKVRLVHTQGTVDERNRLEECCHGANFLDSIQTSPGAPGVVRNDVQVILDNLDGIDLLHVHYTGGTKVMSVETVAALEYNLPSGVNVDTSYLDPRGELGPTIVDFNGNTLVSDTRMGVPADLSNVAYLNGFELGPFKHQYRDNDLGRDVTKNCSAPATLNNVQMQDGANALNRMGSPHPGGFNWQHFEYAAYVALKDALEQISARNRARNNYQIFHSVNIRRIGATQRDPYFELDVVAVLGYQVVVISCTLDTRNAPIKKKGMEVILRARQLGGDEAQAIVLCQANPVNAPRIEKELEDTVGSAGAPLRVWGTNRWADLSNHFYNYLRNDLHWM